MGVVETIRRIGVFILFNLKTFQTNLFLIVERDRNGVGEGKERRLYVAQSISITTLCPT